MALSAFIEDATELATLTPQPIPEDFSYSPELDAEDEAEPYRAPRTGIPTLPVYSAEEATADAALALIDEPDSAKVVASLNAVATAPDAVFDIVMYSIEPRWPVSWREAEYRCSRWLVAARALAGTGLWPRYVAAEKSAERGVVSADAELREMLGKAWRNAGLHQISKHLRPSRHRHHSEKKKIRQQRNRRSEQPREDTRIRLWLCPEVKEQRAAENSGIMRGTLR
ncbi:MAG TPA: hypothetical protein VGH51_02150 [Candidatus Angelobacter sp.]|jgi:hypothetical protein